MNHKHVMKEKGFKIPEDYFTQKKIELKKIARDEKPSKSSERQLKRNHYYLVAAAILAISFFIIYPGANPQDSYSISFSELQEAEVINFLIEDPSGIYPESFIALPENQLDSLNNLDIELIDAYLDETYIPIEYL